MFVLDDLASLCDPQPQALSFLKNDYSFVQIFVFLQRHYMCYFMVSVFGILAARYWVLRTGY